MGVDLLKYLGSGKCGASPVALLASRSIGSVAPAVLAESSLRAAALAKASQTAVAKTDETFMIETRESPEMTCRSDDQLDRQRRRDVVEMVAFQTIARTRLRSDAIRSSVDPGVHCRVRHSAQH